MLSNLTNSDLSLLIVGDYLFEPKTGLLSGPTGAHHICSHLSRLLSCLIEHSNEIVERDCLSGQIRTEESHSSPSLTQCIGQLRHYFGDTARAANYIETVPNRGYRLVTPVYGSTRRPVNIHVPGNEKSNSTFGARVYRLIQEFRKRKVCRSLLIYSIVIWLVFQIAEVVIPALNIPSWVNSLIVLLGILGFPVAATLSWIFDLTPGGFVRDVPAVSGAAGIRSKADLVFDSALVSTALIICGLLVLTSLELSASGYEELRPEPIEHSEVRDDRAGRKDASEVPVDETNWWFSFESRDQPGESASACS